MRIAVTGEGPTDYGKVDYGNPGHWIDGPVQVYLRRIAEEQNIELDFEMIERAEVQKIKLQRRHLNGLDGKAIPARRFYIKCKEKQLNYGVYYCDADRNAGEQNSNVHQLENRYKEVYGEVKEGMYNCDNYIPMIPCRMIENWILADGENIRDFFQVNKIEYNPHNVDLLWVNDNNPESNYPKNVFERIKSSSKNRDIKNLSNSELFYEIAERQNLAIVKKNSSISFARFHDDYISLLRSEMLWAVRFQDLT